MKPSVKRVIAGGSVAVLSVFALGNARPHPVVAAKAHKVIHLVYWNMWSGQPETVIAAAVREFNKTHPDIQVKMLSVPSSDGDAKLATAIAAGDPPDVFTEWNPVIGSYAANHSILPLNQFMTGKYKNMMKWFYPITLKFATFKGKLWAMPMTMNSFMLLYNKGIMKAAGLNPNDPPKTIAQLDTDQAKMWKYTPNGGLLQYGLYPDPGSGVFDIWGQAFGYVPKIKGNTYDVLTPAAVKEMKWFSIFKKYSYAKTTGFIAAFNAAAGGSEDPFDMGKAGFIVNGMWEMENVALNDPSIQYGAVPIPTAPGVKYGGTWVNGNYNIIPKGAKYPKQAFEFMAWMAGYDNANWAGANDPRGQWIPPSPVVARSKPYQKWLDADPLRKKFVDIFSNPHDTITPLSPVQSEYETLMTTAMQQVMSGKAAPVVALKHVQQQLNAFAKK